MKCSAWIGSQLALCGVIAFGCASFGTSHADGEEPGKQRSVAVYALSRGSGVPSATREAYQKAQTLLHDLERDKRAARVEETRLGLEGESRLCAEFTNDENARAAIEKLRALARDVELMNVVEEPCHKSE